MKRTIFLSPFAWFLIGIWSLFLTSNATAQVKGWCEEKYLQRATTIDNRVALPAITASGDDLYVAYRQKNVKVTVSHDRGKTWQAPIDLGAEFKVCSAPTIALVGNKVYVIWPARIKMGELSPFQLLISESVDKGKTWSKPKRLTQNKDDALQPQFLVNGDKVLIAWLETPLSETLGQLKLGSAMDYNVSTPDDLFKMSQKDSGGISAQQKRMRSAVFCSTFDPKTGTMTAPNRLDEIFSEWLPYIFSLYGPINGNYYVTLNRNMEIKNYESKDGGTTWSPYFQDRGYFDSQKVANIKIFDNKMVSVWIPRNPYGSIPVNFLSDNNQSTPLSPPHIVRSTPNFCFSDNVYHVVWEAGQENDSWLTYIRTDDVPPTSKIVSPDSPDITGINAPFAWLGDDNISAQDRLRYSFSYDAAQTWSPIQSETSTTIKTPKDGEYVFKVRSEDVAGNVQTKPAEFKFNTFKSAPDTEITKAPPPTEALNTRQVEITYTGTDNNDAPETLEFSQKADNGNWTPFEKKQVFTFDNLSNGEHTLFVKAKDSRGNIDSTPASCKVLIKVGLELVLDTKPEINTNNAVITFAWTGKDDKGQPVQLTYFYIIDKDPEKKLETNKIDLDKLEEGRHQFTVWGQDNSGDKTAKVTYKWVIDRTPPQTKASFLKKFVGNNFPEIALESIDPPLPDGYQPAVPNKFEYMIEGGKWVPFSTPANTWLFDQSLSYFSWGYNVKIRSIDSSGNMDANPAEVDLHIYSIRPVFFYSVAAVLLIVVFFILKLLFSKLRTPKRVKSSVLDSSETSGFSEYQDSSMDSMMNSKEDEFSFNFDDDDDDDSDKKKKKGKYDY